MSDEQQSRSYSFVVRLRRRGSTAHAEADWQGTLEMVPIDGCTEAPRRRFSRIECIPALIVEVLAETGKKE